MLRITDLECRYGRIPVLKGVSITVDAESVGLFGPNGAGKTTLINAIMGILRPCAGAVEADGRDLTRLKTYEIARSGIALVPQERELFPGHVGGGQPGAGRRLHSSCPGRHRGAA